MHKIIQILSLPVLTLLAFNPLHAVTPLTYETFQNAPVGLVTSAIGDWTPGNVNAADNSTITIHQDTANLFGQGTGFKYLEMHKNTSVQTSALQFTTVNAFPPTSVITLSFLYYEPTDTGNTIFHLYFGRGNPAGSDLGGYINMQNGMLYGSGGTDGANAVSYATETAIRFDLVINNSNTDFDYGDDHNVAGQRFDVWADGVLILNDAQFLTTGSTYDGDLSSIRLIYASGANQNQTVYIGEIGIFEGGVIGAPIPEPTTYAAVFGMLLAAGLFLRRYRQRICS